MDQEVTICRVNDPPWLLRTPAHFDVALYYEDDPEKKLLHIVCDPRIAGSFFNKEGIFHHANHHRLGNKFIFCFQGPLEDGEQKLREILGMQIEIPA